MKKHIRILLFLLVLPVVHYAQLRTVIFDGERSLFDGGNSLPAEEMFFITGGIRPDIELVEVELYKGNFGKKLYTSRWERPFGSTTETFQALFKYKLAGSSEYDLKVNSFRPVTEKEKTALDSAINSALSEYINQSVGKGNALVKPADRIVDDLNNIVRQGMSLYRSKTLNEFEGFSDIIRAKYRALESGDVRRAAAGGASDDKPGNGRAAATRNPRGGQLGSVLDDIKRLCKGEVKQLVSADLTVLILTKEIDRYPTENTMNPVALNVGYGGAYLSGSSSNIDYGQSPYVGLSFPLSSVGTAPAFLRNTSISAGVFTKNFTTADLTPRTVSGPIVTRPYYIGAGYKVLQVVRINVGAAVLETTSLDANNVKTSEVTLTPMVGLSAEIGLWLGLRKR